MPQDKALYIRGKGGPEVLEIANYEVPAPNKDEVSVQVAAAGINRADSLQRRGLYPAPPGVIADVPGLEFAGTVAEVGSDIRDYQRGDRVMGIVAGGAMATRVLVKASELIPVPKQYSLEEAAAIPEAFMTVYDAVFQQSNLKKGETFLIHAVGSGIGTAAIQLAQSAGAHTVGTSRSQEKLNRCKELGLDAGILVQDKLFAKQVLEFAPAGVNVILDTVGAAYLAENMRALATCGRMIVIGLLGGVSAEISLGQLVQKRATIRGSVLRSRSTEEKAQLAQNFRRNVLPQFERGQLKPVIDAVMPMDNAQEAHRLLDADKTFGKIVLRW